MSLTPEFDFSPLHGLALLLPLLLARIGIPLLVNRGALHRLGFTPSPEGHERWALPLYVICEGVLLLYPFFLTIKEGAWLALGMHPRRRSAWRVWLGTNGWLLVVAGFNAVARSNYMFLCKAPEVASPLAAVPWPWYVVIADVLMLVGFLWLERLSRKYGPSHPPR